MWLLHFFSDDFIQFIVHAVFVTGIVSCFLTFVLLNRVLLTLPILASYYQAARAISVVLLVGGIYLEGGLAAESQWRERVREMEARVALAEQAGAVATAKLEKKSQEKVRVIQGQQVVVKQYIDRVVKRYDSSCVIPGEFVKAHNDYAERAK